MRIIEIKSLEEPGIQMFGSLTEAQLRSRLNPSKAVFIAESPKVISVALHAGMEPMALLCERRHIEGDARDIIARCPETMPIYTGERELLEKLTGYTLTRGVLCAMRRPEACSTEALLARLCKSDDGPKREYACHQQDPLRVVVIQSVCDTTNIGAIFRSAAALGIDAVLLTPDSCDPLNRRAVRVSMGSVFLVPWTWLPEDYNELFHRFGFKTVAMALTDQSVPLDDPALKAEPRLAIIMGTEGDGLPHSTIEKADYTVRIPMQHGVDSLNVAAAAAVAFWELRNGK